MQRLQGPGYLPEPCQQGAEGHFQPSKLSPALAWPKEVILSLCYITAPGCTSRWLSQTPSDMPSAFYFNFF